MSFQSGSNWRICHIICNLQLKHGVLHIILIGQIQSRATIIDVKDAVFSRTRQGRGRLEFFEARRGRGSKFEGEARQQRSGKQVNIIDIMHDYSQTASMKITNYRKNSFTQRFYYCSENGQSNVSSLSNLFNLFRAMIHYISQTSFGKEDGH
jgi:hypothetical protein